MLSCNLQDRFICTMRDKEDKVGTRLKVEVRNVEYALGSQQPSNDGVKVLHAALCVHKMHSFIIVAN